MRTRGAQGSPASATAARRTTRLVAGIVAPVTAVRRTVQDPALIRLQLAWAVVMTASWSTTITLTVVAYSTGGSAAVSLAVLARTLPGVLAGPAIGAVVDRGSRQRSMAWAAALCSVACAGAAVARHLVVVVVVAMMVVAIATMVFRAAQSAVMPELVDDPTELVAANVLSSTIESIGVFVGPALAGLLLLWRGPWLTFVTAATLFAVAALSMSVGRAGHGHLRRSTDSAAPATLRELLRVRTARLLLPLVFAQTVVSGALVVLYASLAVDTLDAGVGLVGLLTSAFGLGGVIGSLGMFALAGSPRLGLFTAGALALWSVPLVAVAFSPSLAWLLGLLAVVGLGNVLFDVTIVTLLQRGTAESLLARAFGALETVVVVGLGAGAVVAPLVERLLGPAGALSALGVVLGLVCCGALPGLRRLDALLIAPTRQVALFANWPPSRCYRHRNSRAWRCVWTGSQSRRSGTWWCRGSPVTATSWWTTASWPWRSTAASSWSCRTVTRSVRSLCCTTVRAPRPSPPGPPRRYGRWTAPSSSRRRGGTRASGASGATCSRLTQSEPRAAVTPTEPD